MLRFLAPYKLLIEIIVIGAMVSGALWGVHLFLLSEQEIGVQRERAVWVAQQLAATEATRTRENQLQKDKDDADIKSAEREKALVTALAAASAGSSGLRSTIAAIDKRIATASESSVRVYAAALSAVSGECQRAYLGMAKEAAGHASDSLKLQQAWPK